MKKFLIIAFLLQSSYVFAQESYLIIKTGDTLVGQLSRKSLSAIPNEVTIEMNDGQKTFSKRVIREIFHKDDRYMFIPRETKKGKKFYVTARMITSGQLTLLIENDYEGLTYYIFDGSTFHLAYERTFNPDIWAALNKCNLFNQKYGDYQNGRTMVFPRQALIWQEMIEYFNTQCTAD